MKVHLDKDVKLNLLAWWCENKKEKGQTSFTVEDLENIMSRDNLARMSKSFVSLILTIIWCWFYYQSQDESVWTRSVIGVLALICCLVIGGFINWIFFSRLVSAQEKKIMKAFRKAHKRLRRIIPRLYKGCLESSNTLTKKYIRRELEPLQPFQTNLAESGWIQLRRIAEQVMALQAKESLVANLSQHGTTDTSASEEARTQLQVGVNSMIEFGLLPREVTIGRFFENTGPGNLWKEDPMN